MRADQGGHHYANQDIARTSPTPDLTAVAERLGVNQRHVRRLVAERRIPYLKWGHLLRFDPVELEAWLDRARRD